MGRESEAETLVQDNLIRRGRGRRWLADYPRAVPLAIFLLVAAVTLFSVFSIERGERDRDHAELERQAQTIANAIERRAYSNASFLRAGAALFGSQERVDAELFREFVAGLRLDANYRGSEGIGWAPVIPAGEAAAFEAEINEGRIGSIALVPNLEEQPRRILVPVRFLQPDTLGNRRATGFDMYSEPVLRAAMNTATRLARPTASGLISLPQEGEEGKTSFIVFMPVFDTQGAGRRLRGFIYSPFDASQLLESAARPVQDVQPRVRIFDIDSGQPQLLAETPGWVGKGSTAEREIQLANRNMLIAIEADGEATLSPLSLITLLFGLAVASLLMIVARLLTRQAQEDSRSLEWFAQQDSIRNSLTRELNHRVKNTLANVLSIVSLTRRRAENLEEFAEGLDHRIRALSATHDLLTQSDWGTTPIRSVISVELAPYCNHDDHELIIDGPDVELKPSDALSLGLAVHELATNAAKYGALSKSGGKVSVEWQLVNEGLARIDWIESRGPEVVQPDKRGFGTDLIEKIVAHELRHPVELIFAPEGVRCTLLVPVREQSDFELRSRRRNTTGES